MALVDGFGEIVKTDSASSATLLVGQTNSSSSFVPILTGTTFVQAINGTFSFSDIVFTAEPGSVTGNRNG